MARMAQTIRITYRKTSVHRHTVLLAAFPPVPGLSGMSWCLPLGAGRLYSYYLRFQPLFLWEVLIVVQFFLRAARARSTGQSSARL
jgi:hypothetical protein